MNRISSFFAAAAVAATAVGAPSVALADRQVPVTQVFPGTTCYRHAGSAGLVHLGNDGTIFNTSTSNRMSLVCAVPSSQSWDQHGKVKIALADNNPDQAIECQVIHHFGDGSWFTGERVASTGGYQKITVSVAGFPNHSTKLLCDVPPASGGSWSRILQYKYFAQRTDATGL